MSSTRRSVLAISAVVAVASLAVGFVWGFQAHRLGIFPFKLMRDTVRRAGTVPAPVDVKPRAEADPMLTALPYATSSVDRSSDGTGVTIHDPDRAWSGLSFYHSANGDSALLIDMEGRPVHRWRFPSPNWFHATLLPDGDLLALRAAYELVKMSPRSKVLWRHEAQMHHDLAVAADGRLYVQETVSRIVPGLHPDLPVQDDLIAILSPRGEVLERRSLLEAFLGSSYRYLLPSVSHRDFAGLSSSRGDLYIDLLHANHVEPIEAVTRDGREILPAGLLVSLRNINSIAVLHPDSFEILWLWGPTNLYRQHHPSMLSNGNLLVFDNGVERSRVIELDPESLQIVWQYRHDDFFSDQGGSAQRLPNGNTLITETGRGRAFEVTPDGDIVWEFRNPDYDSTSRLRGTIWRMTRFGAGELPFLDAAPAG